MLYCMLEDCTFDDELSHIVSWEPHGLSFKVHDREGFERILPRWFKEKYESFRCLLEQWGFIKLSRGKNRSCWYQVNFAHGRKSRLQSISKDDFIKGMPEYLSPREEPDLYRMETAETSISNKKNRLRTLRDHSSSTTANSDHYSAANSSASKSSSLKRSREGDDSSLASAAVGPPPSKKEKKTKKPAQKAPPSSMPPPPSKSNGGGCKVCGKDDDHSNLLLCEGCDTESHTYCLDPPLDAVPDEDWFCGMYTQQYHFMSLPLIDKLTFSVAAPPAWL
jgi:HSF-type DNA-binding/PHD-finger